MPPPLVFAEAVDAPVDEPAPLAPGPGGLGGGGGDPPGLLFVAGLFVAKLFVAVPLVEDLAAGGCVFNVVASGAAETWVGETAGAATGPDAFPWLLGLLVVPETDDTLLCAGCGVLWPPIAGLGFGPFPLVVPLVSAKAPDDRNTRASAAGRILNMLLPK